MIETLTLADLCQFRSPLAFSPDAPVALALATMGERQLSSVVVAKDGRPVGIFTERDALGLIARGDYDPGVRLRDLMSPDPVTASPQMTFAEGYARMAEHGFRHLVLADEQGQLYGVLSETDFAHALGAEELMGPRTVADLMTRNPATLPPHASLAAALKLMAERNISSVVVAQEGRALGILSERDAIRLAGADLDLQTTPLAERMSRPLHRIGPDRLAHEASPTMRALGVRRLVVEDARGQLVGILTRRDLLRDIQDVHVRLLRRIVADQGRALQDARRQLSEQSVLRSLLAHAQDLGIAAADAGQTIRFINGAALDALGLAAAAARPLSLPELLAAAGLTAEGFAARLAALDGTERLSLDLCRTAGEQPRWLRLVASAIRDDAGQREGYLLTVQDRTQEYADTERLRRAQESLLEAQAIAHVGSWELDIPGRTMTWSDETCRLFGYAPGAVEPSAKRLLAAMPAADRPACAAALAAALESPDGRYRLEHGVLGPDGVARILLAEGRLARDAQGRPLRLTGTSLDVTRQRAIEDALRAEQKRLRESEARLSAVFDNAPLGMALVGADGRVTLANRALGTFLGCDPDIVVGMPVYGMSPPRERRQDRLILADLIAGRRTAYRATKRYRRMDGREVWGDLRVALLPNRPGEPPSPLGMVEDVTELHNSNAQRQALEEALGRYAIQLEELVDVANLPLPLPEQVRALLSLGCRSLGMAAAVLGEAGGGHDVLAAVRADDPQGPLPSLGRRALEELLDHRGQPRVLGRERLPGSTLEAGLASCIGLAFECPRPDGPPDSLILTLWSAEPSPDLGGPERQILRLVAQRIAALRHNERMQRDLVQAKERETIGHLASGVAHDFNNLLGVIDANLYFLEARLQDCTVDPGLAEVLEDTQSALGQAKVIVSGMLSLSRAGGVPLESVDLESTVAELMRILVKLLPPAIRPSVRIPAGLRAHSNRGFLQAALLNLALNARDAMPAGGDLRIVARTGRWDGSERLAVGRAPAGECIELCVTDTGSGMRPEVLARIFEPLFSTKAKQRGHGLGLFMVHEFVSRSGAGLTVSSRPGEGTRFSLFLPPAGAALAGAPRDAAAAR